VGGRLQVYGPEDSANQQTQLYLDLLKQCLTASVYPESSDREVRPRNPINRIPIQFLNRLGFKLLRRIPFDAEKRRLGKDWPAFGYSMAGLKRLDNLQFCVETAIDDQIPGDFLEAGVWRGGACILMRAILKVRGVTDRTVWLADSFQGLPHSTLKADYLDFSGIPMLAVSQADVEAAFRLFDLLDGQVKFLKGWFKDTLPEAPISELAILRLDGDLYESTMDCLNALYHKVSKGGFVIVDDYDHLAPCKQAVTEFRERHGISDVIKKIDDSGVYWRKSA
jgi:hypothetical protein